MGQVASRVDEEQTSLTAGHGETPAPAVRNQHGGSCWAWIKSKGSQFWSTCMNCCGVTLEGLKGCCACCCSGVWTFICCFGCCAGTCSRLNTCCGNLLTSCGGWCGPRCPLSKKFPLSGKAFADLLDGVATAAVMGILSLNIYCATFFMAWANPNYCAPAIWVKIIIVGLPFTLFPLTLYVSGQAKALQKDFRGVGLVAGSVILEVLYIICLGGIMTRCMSGSRMLPVAIVTCSLSLLLVLGWGCCCYYPKWLRACLRGCCCWERNCQEIDEEALVGALGPAQAMVEVEAAAAALQAAAAAAAAAVPLEAPARVEV